MSNLKNLLSQIDALQKQVAEVRAAEVSEAINKARDLVNEYQLSPEDVFPGTKSKSVKKPSGKVAPKYRDNATGHTWTGRGMAPKWLAGRNRDEFLIKN